ncbi:MAG: VTT domain-containing protein [Opitutales bacterium]
MPPTLTAEKNCWRRSPVEKGGFLLSGRDYFRAFRETVLAAEHELILLAWDLCESLEMIRDEADDDGYPSKLVDFLIAVLEEKPELRINILLWDYSMIYVAEREWLPFTKLGQLKHPRLNLVSDDAVPAGASQHQKLAIVDGAVAMCGGLDLAAWRWDSREHQAHDPRRKSPKGEPYPPYHDMQVILNGEICQDLRDLAASRWERATGETLPPLEASAKKELWPSSAPVDFENTEIAITLTTAKYQSQPPVRQIERFYLEAISGAERRIYIENQYLTSKILVDALCEKLREDQGPEVVMLLTKEAGWAENMTMGRMRNRLLEHLREADHHQRFRCFYPFAAEEGAEEAVYVHAKTMIVDDRILTTGSANLSNRSMRVDTELNLCMIDETTGGTVARLEERLLALHLHHSEDTVKQTLEETGSLIGTLEKLNRSDGNRLCPLDAACESELERKIADSELLDPEEPLSPIHNLWDALQAQNRIYWKDTDGSPYLKLFKILGGLVAFLVTGLIIAQFWKSGFDQDQATSLLASLKDSAAMIPLVILVFVVGGIIAVPINLLVIATALTLGSWAAIGCGLTGSMIAAAGSFGLGHYLGKPLVRRIIGNRIDIMIAALKGRGVGSMIVIRLLPIAPFGLLNLVAGASGLRFRIYMIGSAIGMLPGLVTVVLATNHLQKAVTDPNWESWLIFFALVGLILGIFLWAKKKFA